MTRARSAVVAALLVTAGAPAASAQDIAHRGFCFRGRPRTDCGSFPLIEMGVATKVTDLRPSDERTLVTWTLGAMRNTGPRTAVGLLGFAAAEGNFRAGAGVRGRWWVSRDMSLDLTAGLHLAGEAPEGRIQGGAPTFQLRINAGDYIAGTIRYDRMRLLAGACPPPYNPCPTTAPQTLRRVYIGGEVGSYPGTVAVGGSAVLLVILLLFLPDPVQVID